MLMLSIVIPAYNEEDGIADISHRVLAVAPDLRKVGVQKMELLVVDDGSHDRTGEIANQIDTLRKNMEKMESVKTEAPKVDTPAPAATPEPAPAPEVTPEPAPEAVPEPTPEPVAEPVAEPEPIPEPAAEPEPAPAVEAAPSEGSDQLDFLLQQKDRLKAQLTDLRFDYMRGYIPEDEYKTKESELDTQLEDVDKQISALK